MSRQKISSPSGITSLLPSELKLESSHQITSLWAGYGSITRLSVIDRSTSALRSLVLKTVRPPTSSRSDESHLRKTISYNVERYFYTHLSTRLRGVCAVAESIEIQDAQSLLLSDLSVNFPYELYGGLDMTQTYAVLHWLAYFHAAFWDPEKLEVQTDGGKLEALKTIPPPLQAAVDAGKGVWQQGGYWYLDTRSSEYDSMTHDQEWEWLTLHAADISDKIKSVDSTHKTLLHGDPKAANIFFSHKPLKQSQKEKNLTGLAKEDRTTNCALYDFQYVGMGLCTQDLVYFLTTSTSARLLEEQISTLLKYYHDELHAAYIATHEGDFLGYPLETLLEHWEMSVVDWLRFMAGWGMWGSCDWVEARGREIVKKWTASSS